MRRTPPAISVRFMLLLAGALVAVEALVVVLIKPPAFAWIGFAIVAAIVLCLAALTPLAFERTRVSPPLPARPHVGDEQMLVVADPLCSEVLLCEAIIGRRARARAVHVVVPIRVSPLHFLTDDESAQTAEAEETMSITVGLLRRRGIPATGSIGSDKPLESMTDALRTFAATRVLLATPPDSKSYWLERGLLAKARQLTSLPLEQIYVAQPTVTQERKPAKAGSTRA